MGGLFKKTYIVPPDVGFGGGKGGQPLGIAGGFVDVLVGQAKEPIMTYCKSLAVECLHTSTCTAENCCASPDEARKALNMSPFELGGEHAPIEKRYPGAESEGKLAIVKVRLPAPDRVPKNYGDAARQQIKPSVNYPVPKMQDFEAEAAAFAKLVPRAEYITMKTAQDYGYAPGEALAEVMTKVDWMKEQAALEA